MIRGRCEGGLAAERVCLGQRLLPFLSVSLGPRFKDMPSAFQTGNWRRLEACCFRAFWSPSLPGALYEPAPSPRLAALSLAKCLLSTKLPGT